MRSWHHLWRSYGGPLPVKKKHESYFCGSWQVVALKSCGVAKDLKKCFCLLFLPQSWLEHGGPLFFRLNHERVDFVPSSLEAIDKTPQPKSGCIAQNKANLVSTFEKKHVIIPCICGKSMKKLYIYIYVYRVGLFPFQAIVATRIVTFLPLLYTGKGDNPICVQVTL